jgi:hypothetical protein
MYRLPTIPFCTASAKLQSRWSVQHFRSILPLAPARLPNRESYHTVAQHQHGASTHMPTNLWQPGVSGNPAGRLRGSRNALSEEVICALLRDFRQHGQKAIAQVRTRQPAAYLKVLALLVPREHKVELTNAYEGLSTEQIEAYIAAIQDRLDRRAAGDQAKVIDGEPVETTALPAPVEVPKPKRRNRVMAAADTAVFGRDEA